jgi:hypothetical protein
MVEWYQDAVREVVKQILPPRCVPLAKAFPRTYARPALQKVFVAFPADTKVA